MENLHHQIKRECTGDADELAEKLGVSRRTLFNYMEAMRIDGHTINYCRYRKTYYFEPQEKLTT